MVETKPIKVFISQVMRDKTEEEILTERNLAIDKVKKIFPNREVEIIDSYFEDYNPTGGSIPLKYLSKAVDKVVLTEVSTYTARGCKIEHQCAVEYGINRIYG